MKSRFASAEKQKWVWGPERPFVPSTGPFVDFREFWQDIIACVKIF